MKECFFVPKIVYANEEVPDFYTRSVFLVGPTPRDAETPSWRPAMIEELAKQGFNGVIFSPEPRDGQWQWDYDTQVEWEKKCLTMADIILAWVPRELEKMPAFTTNVEFGTWIDSHKLVYGRPPGSKKNTYLDWLYKDRGYGQPHQTMETLAAEVVRRTPSPDRRFCPGERHDGERHVPLHIWSTRMFQDWYGGQLGAGNHLEEAKVLWEYHIGDKLFAFAMRVKVYILDEKRYKENEFIISRPDISVVMPFYLDDEDLFDSKVVLIKEFRSTVNNLDAYVYELPGGSTFKKDVAWESLAAAELKEETGIDVEPNRLQKLNARQLNATFSTHKAHLFSVRLTYQEIQKIEHGHMLDILEAGGFVERTYGVEKDSERTYLQVHKLRDILEGKRVDVDWSMIGMIFEGVANHVRGRIRV